MLQYILQEFAKETGLPINSNQDRAATLTKINKAARELYSTTDLVGCLREQVFNVDASHLQITLPYYVDQTRAARHYDTRSRVKIEDMRPRYFYGRDWPQKFLTWRHKNRLAVCNDMVNTGPLAISIAAVDSVRFKVTIVGSTANADRAVETIIFEVGDTIHHTVNNFTPFPGIQIIGKDQINNQNVDVTDAGGIHLARIANCELESSYTLIAIGDYQNQLGCDCYEILYKWKFSPFFNDYDIFPAPNYDDAIVYKATSQFWSRDTTEMGQAKVMEYELKCQKVLEQRALDGEGSDEKEIQFGKNQYFDVMGYGFPTGFSSDLPARIF